MTTERSASLELGLVLPIGPVHTEPNRFVDDVDTWLGPIEDRVSGLWVTDHLQWDSRPTFEAWTTLSFMAARWPLHQMGTVVLGQSYRNAGLLAKMAATLQVLSGGRLVVGVGAGWKEDEYRSYGYPYPSAGQRVDELSDYVDVLRAAWTQAGPVNVLGRHAGLTDAFCEPCPVRAPTLMIGGGGTRTLGIVARCADWWSLPDCTPATYTDRLSELRRQCDRIGRDPSSVRLTWFGRIAVAPTEQQAIDLSGGKWTSARAVVGTPTQVLDRLDEFAELGVDVITAEVLGLHDPAIADLFHDEVAPRFNVG
jgi:alkanesulfonate monooxygenase SsuD/methylene tetrahydromethanopterin reductase-like flavin-dependent oxidoreductase (luciferase family)